MRRPTEHQKQPRSFRGLLEESLSTWTMLRWKRSIHHQNIIRVLKKTNKKRRFDNWRYCMAEEWISRRHRYPASVFLFFSIFLFLYLKKKSISHLWKKTKRKEKRCHFFLQSFVFILRVCICGQTVVKKTKNKRKKIYKVPAIVDYLRIVNCVKICQCL